MRFSILESSYNYLTFAGNRMLNFVLVVSYEGFNFFCQNIVICPKICGKTVLLVLETLNFHTILTCLSKYKATLKAYLGMDY